MTFNVIIYGIDSVIYQISTLWYPVPPRVSCDLDYDIIELTNEQHSNIVVFTVLFAFLV